MKIATFIIALGLVFLMGFQACAVFGLGSVSDSLQEAEEPSETTSAGALGVLAAFLTFLGMAFTLGKPGAACWLFILAALCAFGAGALSFTDMYIWGVVVLVLAVMASKSRENPQPKPEVYDPVQEQRRLYIEQMGKRH